MNKDKFVVIINIKDFIYFIDSIIVNYPKKEYVLKDRLQETSYCLLELAYIGNVTDEKIKILKKMISKINMLDFYLEMSYNKKCLSQKKLNVVCRKLETITKLIYGWIKSVEC